MAEIQIAIKNKIPEVVGDVKCIVSDNSDYLVRFSFDDQWGDGEKTAYFVLDDGYAYPPVTITDGVASVPRQHSGGIGKRIYIGVSQGNIRTSRGIGLCVVSSVTDMIDDSAVQPDPSMWEGIVQRIMELEMSKLSPVAADAGMSKPVGVTEDGQLMTAPDVFWARYDETKYTDIRAAFESGKMCFLRTPNGSFPLINVTDQGASFFGIRYQNDADLYHVTPADVWSRFQYTMVTSLDKTGTIDKDALSGKVPTDKAVYDAIFKYATGGGSVTVDETLSISGAAADAKVTGEKIGELSEAITDQNEVISGIQAGTYIDYDANVKAVNHRGYSTTAPENTIPAYIMSKQKGFKYVECDVAFTSDNVAVLLHDTTIDRTSDGSGSISSLTYADVLQYDFGSWKSAEYTGTKIPTFEEFIMLCKAIGLHPYIELKSSGAYTEEQIAGIVSAVKAHGMEGKVTYISFNDTFLTYVKNADSKARLGYLADVTTSAIATAIGLKTEDNEVFLDVSYNNVTEEKVNLCIENDLPLEIWTVNSESVVQNMDAYITGVTSDNLIAGKILYNKYMEYVAPEEPDSPPKTLTSISAAYTGGDVPEGTALADLTGIVVTATYSDGSTATVTGYTLSGEIVEGSNTITVSYSGKTTTFVVTGVSESGGEDEPGTDAPENGTLLHSWDLTKGLTDSVGGLTASINKSSDTCMQADGFHLLIYGVWQAYNVVQRGRRIEVDISAMNAQYTTRNGRFIMFTDKGDSSIAETGFIYRNTGAWSFYCGGWSDALPYTDKNAFAGKTLAFEFDADGYVSFYVDDEFIAKSTVAFNVEYTNLRIGDTSYAAHEATITAVRVYA